MGNICPWEYYDPAHVFPAPFVSADLSVATLQSPPEEFLGPSGPKLETELKMSSRVDDAILADSDTFPTHADSDMHLYLHVPASASESQFSIQDREMRVFISIYVRSTPQRTCIQIRILIATYDQRICLCINIASQGLKVSKMKGFWFARMVLVRKHEHSAPICTAQPPHLMVGMSW